MEYAKGAKRDREDGEDHAQPEKKVFVGELEVNQEDEEWIESEAYYDDKTGKQLQAKLVKAAEEEELAFMNDLGVGEETTLEECWRQTGKAPITTKFVRVNKGSVDEPDVRGRLCARDFKVKGGKSSVELFASMPPLEAKKLLFRQAVLEATTGSLSSAT